MSAAKAKSYDIDSSEGLRNALRHQIESQTLDLPLMPRVAQQVVQMTQDSQSGVADLAKLIESDPALCAHVLRIANSPLYAANVKLVSVRQALSRLGTELLSQLALSVAMKSGVFNNRRFLPQLAAIWKLGLIRSYFSREIARIRRDNVEQAFLSALMLEIGKPVMFHAITQLDEGNSLIDAEEICRIVDDFQSQAGYIVAQAWELPEVVSACITATADDDLSTSNASDKIATVHLASLFAQYMIEPSDDKRELIQSHDTLEILNLYPEDIASLFASSDSANKLVEAFS